MKKGTQYPHRATWFFVDDGKEGRLVLGSKNNYGIYISSDGYFRLTTRDLRWWYGRKFSAKRLLNQMHHFGGIR